VSNDATWWQQGIVYKTNSDIPGIISRLDYFTWLGVTAIWIAPNNPSPGADFDRLAAEAHNRGLRVIRGMSPTPLPLNLHLLSAPWNAASIAALIKQSEAALPHGSWPTWALGNHDHTRLAAMSLLTLRGTPILYNGDELGMRDVAVAQTNVEVQSQDDTSLLSLYRSLIFIHQLEPALTVGAYREMQVDGDLFVYERLLGHQRFVIALNFGSHELPFHLRTSGAIAASTHPERPVGEHNVEDSAALATTLQPFEGIVIRVA